MTDTDEDESVKENDVRTHQFELLGERAEDRTFATAAVMLPSRYCSQLGTAVNDELAKQIISTQPTLLAVLLVVVLMVVLDEDAVVEDDEEEATRPLVVLLLEVVEVEAEVEVEVAAVEDDEEVDC